MVLRIITYIHHCSSGFASRRRSWQYLVQVRNRLQSSGTKLAIMQKRFSSSLM